MTASPAGWWSDAPCPACSKLKTTTIFGDYAVDECGYQIANKGLFVQWQDGMKVVVWPDQFATAKPRIPTPAWSLR